MKAIVYRGPRSVAVEQVPDPAIETPLDAIVRITTTNICGSDLHMYEGRTAVEEGTVLGHENMGIVEEVGPAVERIKVGDRVSVPFNIACGTCRNCQAGDWTAFCLRTNPNEGIDGAAYGYSTMGPYRGGQAEYLRVPYADVNLLELPPGNEHELDFTMLSDIFPTGYHGTELAGRRPRRPAWPSSAPDRSGSWRPTAPSSAARRASSSSTRSPTASPSPTEIGAEPVDFSERRPGRADHATRRAARASTGESRPSATRPTTRRARSTPSSSGQPGDGGPLGGLDRRRRRLRAPRTRARRTSSRSRAASPSSTAPSSPRASAWAPGRRP